MSQAPHTRPRPRGLFAALLILDVVLTLCPPVYWFVGNRANPVLSLLYFVGGGAVVLAGILVMYALDRPRATTPGGRS
ncbi:hypothetical protein [Microbispora sp. GKU 823]|uniref:hypothetical protein n=1 Tax=Microbispora sp. GKU 823 TaxID=1652100 RepID=UPI0009A3F1B4|nr:hypothetical protein [Microbispora sp. GKU 823]OPG05231.1 hypothetical protein B1L11_35790 [Microbispora sp. GKU 823]